MAKMYNVNEEASTRQVPDKNPASTLQVPCKYPASLGQIIMLILTSCALYNTIYNNKE